MPSKSTTKRRMPTRVRDAKMRVIGMERARAIVAQRWVNLLPPGWKLGDAVDARQAALWACVEAIDAAMRQDDHEWRTWQFPEPTEAPDATR